MSHPLIEHSSDLQKLKDNGYAVSIKDNHLVIEHIPFVDDKGDVVYGALISEITAQGNTALRPNDHVVSSTHKPNDHTGNQLSYLILDETTNVVAGHTTACRLSNTPGKEPDDYYEKLIHYIELIVPHAQSIDSSVTAKVNNPVDSSTDHVFNYIDSNTSRAGTAKYISKFISQKIAIIGLGGTGSYILDQVAKTPVREIHLYDDDVFSNHNAFRSPGAATIDDLNAELTKVSYAAKQFGAMHRFIIPHETRITTENLNELTANDFIFLCIDDPASRRLVAEALVAENIPFIDVGISLEVGQLGLTGAARTTRVYPGSADEALARLPLEDTKDDIYSSNIQMAEINMLNAAYAIIMWKQWSGFYFDARSQHELVAFIDTGMTC